MKKRKRGEMQIELEKLIYAIRLPIPKELLQGEPKFVADIMSDMLAFHLEAFVWAQSLCDYKHPKNWKEAFKERWFPKWLLKKFPVKYAVLDIKEIYPDYRRAPEALGNSRIIITS